MSCAPVVQMADFMGARKMVEILGGHFRKLFTSRDETCNRQSADEFSSLVRMSPMNAPLKRILQLSDPPLAVLE